MMKSIALYLTSFFLLLLSLPMWAAPADTLLICTQEDFNVLSRKIDAAVKSGAKSVVVDLGSNTFRFRERHLTLSSKHWDDVDISIRGNGCLLLPMVETDTLMPDGLIESDRLIEVVDEESKLCRVHVPKGRESSRVRELEGSGADGRLAIRITQWFKSLIYSVERISKNWIYFTASDLAFNKSYNSYNVNLDYGYTHKRIPGQEVMPRFRLEYPNATDDEEKVPTRFLTIDSSTFGSFEMRGVRIGGNGETPTPEGGHLIYISKAKANSITLSNCRFTGIRSRVVEVRGSENVNVERCHFNRCYNYGVNAAYSFNTRVAGCKFEDMSLASTNTFCIRCSGKDYYVADNELRNFGSCGIAVGTWWKADKRTEETGIVENNELYFTPSYMADWLSHSTMDTGAIYIYTQNDDVTVRHNYIHDYNGACDNNGIYCDDGAYNFQIYGNVILNTPNGYSIDSRYTPNIEKSRESKTAIVNVNNRIYDNVIDGPIRFEGREGGDNQCRLGQNVLLKAAAPTMLKGVRNNAVNKENKTLNLDNNGSFVAATSRGMLNGKVVVSEESLRKIESLRNTDGIMQHFITR